MIIQPKKGSGGRPRRAGGEKLKKMSISIRQVSFEVLELLARQRRTSVSQIIEQLSLEAGRDALIDGAPVITLAGELAALDGSVFSTIKRVTMLPESLLSSAELFARDVLAQGPTPTTEAEAVIFQAVVLDAISTGADVSFASSLWVHVRDAWANGAKTFKAEDNFGFGYVYVLNHEGSDKDVIVKMDHPQSHENALTNIIVSARKQTGKKD